MLRWPSLDDTRAIEGVVDMVLLSCGPVSHFRREPATTGTQPQL